MKKYFFNLCINKDWFYGPFHPPQSWDFFCVLCPFLGSFSCSCCCSACATSLGFLRTRETSLLNPSFLYLLLLLCLLFVCFRAAQFSVPSPSCTEGTEHGICTLSTYVSYFSSSAQWAVCTHAERAAAVDQHTFHHSLCIHNSNLIIIWWRKKLWSLQKPNGVNYTHSLQLLSTRREELQISASFRIITVSPSPYVCFLNQAWIWVRSVHECLALKKLCITNTQKACKETMGWRQTYCKVRNNVYS